MTTAQFKDAMTRLGLDAEQMAVALGLGPNGKRTIYRIRAGGRISGPMALAVQKLLDDAR